MTRFIIRATDGSHMSVEIGSDHPEAVFHAVKTLNCKAADVLVDDVYTCSVRVDAKEVWTIFQHNHEEK